MTINEVLVESEPVELLLEALTGLTEKPDETEGLVRLEGQLSGDSGAALVHALGRLTAELHAADMRSFLPGATPNRRTAEARGADALLILVERLREAVAKASHQ
jgi:hypothetical protein